MGYPARHDQIVRAFLAIPHARLINFNWGTAPDEHRDEWHVNDETYINGVPLIVDLDYEMGYLLEVVDRTTSQVSYLVVVRFPYEEHDSMMYEGVVGTFFDREIDVQEASVWALDRIYGLLDNHHEND